MIHASGIKISIPLMVKKYRKCANNYSYTELNQRRGFFRLSTKKKILQDQDRTSYNQMQIINY
jgi:hypothetical protein